MIKNINSPLDFKVNNYYKIIYAFGIVDNWLKTMDEYFSDDFSYTSIKNHLAKGGVNKELIDSIHIVKDFFEDMTDKLNNKNN